MSTVSEKWSQIIGKIQLILERNLKLEAELAQNKLKLETAEADKKRFLEEKEELLNQINVLKLAKGVGITEREKVEVKKQIKHYISEIDDCLAKMNA
jgi:phage gp16-like protein